jgi:hypothetical protein
MMSMSDELKERNILKLILIVRFACATLDMGDPIVDMNDVISDLVLHFGSDYSLVRAINSIE